MFFPNLNFKNDKPIKILIEEPLNNSHTIWNTICFNDTSKPI